MVASPAMPFVERNVDTLSPAANLGEFTLPLACTAVVIVRDQIHTFVVAASGIVATLNVANLFIFVAMVSCSRVLSFFLKEATYPFGRHWQGLSLWECG